jgi:hypothetical protein
MDYADMEFFGRRQLRFIFRKKTAEFRMMEGATAESKRKKDETM